MPNYRLYRLDPYSGHFIGVEIIEAANDADAIEHVSQLAYGNSVELWNGKHKVARIDAPPEAAAFVPDPGGRALH